MEALQRENRAQAWFDPEDLGIVARVRHREDSAAIGEHQEFGFDHPRGARGVHVNGLIAWEAGNGRRKSDANAECMA